MKKIKGSLSLEAVISFTIFISFMFILMLIVKMAITVMALDTVTSEVAKQVATSAYPLGMFNAIADDNDEKVESYEEVTTFTGKIVDNTSTGIFSYLSRNLTGEKVKDIKKDTILSNVGVFLKAGADKIANLVYDSAEELLGKAGTEMVKDSIQEGIVNYSSSIDMSKLKLVVCKFPMPQKSYENGCETEGYSELGLEKKDFGADDVIIGITYDYPLAVPFFPTFDIKLKSVAIEHAWVKGGACEPVSSKEGIDFDKILYGKHFYTGTGGYSKRYHKGTCISLWREGRVEAISVATILEHKGMYTPCKLCKPKIKED